VLELALLADERLPASRLLEMGWLNRVVPEGTALAVALDWARRIAGLAPAAIRAAKELAWLGTHAAPDEVLARGHEHARRLVTMHDTVEGGLAFAERRPPHFEDR
jgi:acetyl-CoA C-acetyltransferase